MQRPPHKPTFRESRERTAPSAKLRLVASCSIVLGLLVCLCAGQAQAQERKKDWPTRSGHFDPASGAWSGMSGFIAQATALGLRVETPQIWDWRQADIRVPIMIFAPLDDKLSRKPLREFVEAGGRVLLCDDFAMGLRLMETFGLDAYRLGVAQDRWRKRRDVDIHRTYPYPGQDADFLLRQASFLFLNVPQWLISRQPQNEHLLRSRPYNSTMDDYKMGGSVLFRIRYGWGTLIVVSDPSLFINQMFTYGDNRRFAKNVLRYLTIPSRSKRVVLLWGNFIWHGKFEQDKRQALWPRQISNSFWEGVMHANKELTPLPALYAKYPPLWVKKQRPSLHPKLKPRSRLEVLRQFYLYPYVAKISMLMVLLMTWLGWLFFYLPGTWRTGRYDPKLEERRRTVSSRFEEQLESYRDGIISYLWPTILLKEELVVFLAEEFELQEHLRGRDPRELATLVLELLDKKAIQENANARFRKALIRLRKLIKEIPGRHQWGHLNKRPIESKDLKAHYHEVMECLELLGLKQKFRKPYLGKRGGANGAAAQGSPTGA